MGPTETEIPITALLTRVSAGDADAAEELMSRLYPDLRRIAARSSGASGATRRCNRRPS